MKQNIKDIIDQFKEYDYLNFKGDKEIQKIIKDELILFSGIITKINRKDAHQERNIIITNGGIYNLKKKALKRRIPLDIILGITSSSKTNELVIHGKEVEYDYYYVSPKKRTIIQIVGFAYFLKENKKLKFVEINDASLADYVTTKIDKKENASFSKMDFALLKDIDLYLYGNYTLNMVIEKKKWNLNGLASTMRWVNTHLIINNGFFTEEDKQRKRFLLENMKGIGAFAYSIFGLIQLVKLIIKPKTNETINMRKSNISGDKANTNTNSSNTNSSASNDIENSQSTSHNTYGGSQCEYFLVRMIEFPPDVLRDKNFLVCLLKDKFPFVASFEFILEYDNRTLIFMNFEQIQGGFLFDQLRKHIIFAEDTARFYACQIGLIIDYFHNLGLEKLYISPENFLLDLKGNVKYINYELDYNQVLSKDALSYKPSEEFSFDNSDWFNLGVILYEMSFGFAPYFDTQGNLKFPKVLKVSDETKNILNELLVKKSINSLDDLKSQQYFANIDFDQVMNMEIQSPLSFVTEVGPHYINSGNYEILRFDYELEN